MGHGTGALAHLGKVGRMNILVTGNLGYVGPVVVAHLRKTHPDARIVGVDNGWFAHCLTTRDTVPELLLDEQRYGDVRSITENDLRGFDAVVHLAAVSNDPMGNRFEDVTDAINRQSSIRIAELAARAGVGHFAFASSCSIYGFAADGKARSETDAVNPLTAYARSKIGTETGLAAVTNSQMVITCLRFATACGMSPRLRLDLVLNDFVACALSSGEITVLSDGTPWRPLIHVSDMARAIDWAITRDPDNGGHNLRVNVGSANWNYQVAQLAQAVQSAVPGTRVSINTNAAPDNRSYKVDFSLYRDLAPDHQPRMTLDETISGLHDGLMAIGFADRDFRHSPFMRLKVLDQLIASGQLDNNLNWTDARAS